MKSGAQITQERQAWARGKLIVAWRHVECLAATGQLSGNVKDQADQALRWAVAIGEDWGLDAQHVVESVSTRALLGDDG